MQRSIDLLPGCGKSFYITAGADKPVLCIKKWPAEASHLNAHSKENVCRF